MTYEERLSTYAQYVHEFLDKLLSEKDCQGQEQIIKAMRYSAIAGGKRLRPALVMEFYRLSGGNPKDVLPFAVALEMIHTYSLIHDDLPCMDNDDFRRGKPTNHKVYGEAMAVLAGDALLTEAFALATRPENLEKFTAEQIVKATNCLAKNAGVFGMIGGQVIDIESEHKKISYDELVLLQKYKTGALIESAVQMGCILGGADENKLKAAKEYAYSLGLAFQIQDDILDIEGDAEIFGKPIGSDIKKEKSTFPSQIGLDNCKEKVKQLTQNAISAVKNGFEESEFLIWLADKLSVRNN